MRLLMDEPNVLLLDEPTNDLDIDTLTALEDLLDGWPGTLVVVSHDRYFVERVCDNVYASMGDGAIRHLPGGIDQYLELRHAAEAADAGGLAARRRAAPLPPPSGAVCARRARRSPGWSARWRSSPRARPQLHERDGRRRHRSRVACASSTPSCARCGPSARSSKPPGWRRSEALEGA